MWVGIHDKTQANVLCARDKKGQRITECRWVRGERVRDGDAASRGGLRGVYTYRVSRIKRVDGKGSGGWAGGG